MSERLRTARFDRVHEQLAELITQTTSPAAHRATAAALLLYKIPGVSWTGFYLLQASGELIVDAYQGPLACLVLPRHSGVCWAAIDRDETIIVGDVLAFPGHIACDDRTRSELVVPIHGPEGRPIGVLDIDSYEPDHFDEVHEHGFEAIIRLLETRWNEISRF